MTDAETRRLADRLGVTHTLMDHDWLRSLKNRQLVRRSGSCGICSRPAEAVFLYQEMRLYLLPVEIAVDPDGLPPEICCAACALRRHGVDVELGDTAPS